MHHVLSVSSCHHVTHLVYNCILFHSIHTSGLLPDNTWLRNTLCLTVQHYVLVSLHTGVSRLNNPAGWNCTQTKQHYIPTCLMQHFFHFYMHIYWLAQSIEQTAASILLKMCAGSEWKMFDRPRTEILNKEWFISIIIVVWLVPGYMNPFTMGTEMHYAISQLRTRSFSFCNMC